MALAGTIESYLKAHHVEFDLVAHHKAESSHDSAQAAHVMEDHLAKAVILKDKQGYAMAVIRCSDWLKLKALKEETDRDFVLADEAEIIKLFTDCEPGAIPPLGPAYDMETFLDERLTTLANVFFEAGDHQNLVHIRGEAFHELLKGVRQGHFSHDDK